MPPEGRRETNQHEGGPSAVPCGMVGVLLVRGQAGPGGSGAGQGEWGCVRVRVTRKQTPRLQPISQS